MENTRLKWYNLWMGNAEGISLKNASVSLWQYVLQRQYVLQKKRLQRLQIFCLLFFAITLLASCKVGGGSNSSSSSAASVSQDIVTQANSFRVEAASSSVAAGSNLSVTVTALDGKGFAISNYSGTVSFTSSDSQATLPGSTAYSSKDQGKKAFTVVLKTAGSRTVTVTSGGTSTTSAAITVTTAAATKLGFSTQPSSTAVAATDLVAQPQVEVLDAYSNRVSSATNSITLAAYSNSTCTTAGTGTLNGTVTASAVSGVTIGFAGIDYTLSGSLYLRAASTGLTSACANLVTVSNGTPTKLGFTTQPSSLVTAGVNFSSQPKVAVQDANGNTTSDVGSTTTITLAGYTNSICTAATGTALSGTLAVAAVSGVSTYTNINHTVAQTIYIRAAGGGYTAACSSAVSVSPNVATTIASTTGNSQTGTVGQTLPTKLTVTVTDAYTNTVSGTTVAWAVSSGDGDLDINTNPTNSVGISNASYKLGPTSGTHTITASVSGLTGSPITFTETANDIDTWVATNTVGAIAARSGHCSAWTGTDLFVWGGIDTGGIKLNTGGVYNLTGNSWTATTTTGATTARDGHSCLYVSYAGPTNRIIVWGGENSVPNRLDTGGSYNPALDIWTATDTSEGDRPATREAHTAVWDTVNSVMLIWGGVDGATYRGTGAKYNPTEPAGNAWVPITTTSAPSARYAHSAVWTGTGGTMIVWGGETDATPTYTNTGGVYNSTGDSWTATTTTAAPSARREHSGVWTNTTLNRMIVWAGRTAASTHVNDGGLYHPTNGWTSVSSSDAPVARREHVAAWADPYGMIIWGGWNGTSYYNSGGFYDPIRNAWASTSLVTAPTARAKFSGAWTGSVLALWGGETATTPTHTNTGGRYTPKIWSDTATTSAPSARYGHTAVWNGTYMIIWGGADTSYLNTGARFDPTTNSWLALTTTNAATARYHHSAVWDTVNLIMVVWGGYDGSSYLNSGGRYNPALNTWDATALDTTGAPTARFRHTGVWTGTRMVVWGGQNASSAFNTGGSYNPTTNVWTATTTTSAPSARYGHTAIINTASSLMQVWGGYTGSAYVDSGGLYNYGTDSWTAMTTTSPPTARAFHSAVWDTTSLVMRVWGGVSSSGYLSTGGTYDDSPEAWVALNNTDAPTARAYHTAIYTGSRMIIWGGLGSSYFNDGGEYDATNANNPWAITPAKNAPAARAQHTMIWDGTRAIIWGGTNGASFSSGSFYKP